MLVNAPFGPKYQRFSLLAATSATADVGAKRGAAS
jgi:hypothetical protein